MAGGGGTGGGASCGGGPGAGASAGDAPGSGGAGAAAGGGYSTDGGVCAQVGAGSVSAAAKPSKTQRTVRRSILDLCNTGFDDRYMLAEQDASTTVADEPNPPATDKPASEKGLADLLVEAFRLYREHARPMLLICALLFVPASLAKSCVMSAILGPKLAAGSPAEVAARARAADASGRALADAYEHDADRATITRLQHDNQARLADVARLAEGPGGIALWFLGVLATLVSTLAFGVAVPLISGAITVAIADRLTGGRTGWVETWALVLGRAGPLLGAIVPAAGLIAIGLVLWVIPGLVVAFCFALVAQVALFEGLKGAAALRRSVELVGADWLRIALLLAVFGALTWAARLLADLVIPDSAVFTTQLIGDLLTLGALPLPLIAAALLYFDLRKRRDGFGDEALRAALVSLRR
jgi:hypothetical protein